MHVQKMNVAMYQNGVYTNNINKIFTHVTSNTIDAQVETEYTSWGIGYIKTNFALCTNRCQFSLQRMTFGITISTYTY